MELHLSITNNVAQLSFLCDVYLFFCSIRHTMDNDDKHDVHAEIRLLQLSYAKQEISQQGDNACSPQIYDVHCHAITGLQTRGNLQHEICKRNIIMSLGHSSEETTSTQDATDFTEVKQEMKSDGDGYGGNTNLTRHWVTCPGGVLKEVKLEHTPDVSEILPVEDCGDMCGKSLLHSSRIKTHERKHTGVKPFSCETCGRSFSSSSHLKVHERIHTGVKPFACDTCGKTFVSSNHLKLHAWTHTDAKPFACATCGKTFSCTSSLKVHERRHTGVKPFACHMCEKSFTDLSTRKMHERTHMGVKPFACATCGKTFSGTSDLKVHERIHTGLKPFTCDTCGKTFIRSSHLKLHERTHTGVKPFTCVTCGRSFSRADNLKMHERTHTQV